MYLGEIETGAEKVENREAKKTRILRVKTPIVGVMTGVVKGVTERLDEEDREHLSPRRQIQNR